MRLPISTLLALLLLTLMNGCGKKDFQFTEGNACWETTTEFPQGPFGKATIKIQVFNERLPTPRPRRDQVALIHRVVEGLPELMPVIIQKLAEYDEDLKDPTVFREQLVQPAICLFDPDEQPSRSWSFSVERPSFGESFVYVLDFVDKEFKEIGAGD